MSEHLQAAIKLSQDAADRFDRAGGDVSERMKELYLRNRNENIQLSLAAAAIAQAEAAERSAVAMEKIAALLDTVIGPSAGSTFVLNTYDCAK